MGLGSLSHSLGKGVESISPSNHHFPAPSPSPLQFPEVGEQNEGPCCFPGLELELEGEMGKPPSLSHHRGLRAGCDFLSQTKARLWHLSADSCVAQLLNSRTQGRGQFGEGREHRHMYPHSIPLLTHTTPVDEMPPVAHPTPAGPHCTPRTQSFGNRTPIPHGPTALPTCTYLAKTAARALRHHCPAKEELG